jgi:hypothetical protein
MYNQFVISLALITMKYYELLEYYAIYMWLSLPHFVFGYLQPMKFITFDEEDNKIVSFSLIEYVNVITTQENSSRVKVHQLGQGHILPLINDGKLMISDLKKYFPMIDTLVVSYTKSVEDQVFHIERVVDISKKYDVRNTESCSTGIKIC